MSDREPVGGVIVDAIREILGAAGAGPAGPTADATLYVGYSGGLDSTVLLHAAHRLYGDRVVALHVNHGLAAEAGDWQRHCARVCRQWRIDLRSRDVVLSGGNREAAARAARYAYFEEMLDAGDALLLAHHQDDQAETVLLRIAQGRGLIGMPAQRRVGAGQLLRPLLTTPRAALEEYARTWNLGWVEDTSNADVELDRNYLRARVLPTLRARWPDIGTVLSRLVTERRALDEMLLEGLDPAAPALPIRDLVKKTESATLVLLRLWLQARGAVAPSGRALSSFVAQLGAPEDRQPVLALSVGTLRRYRDSVHHVPDPPRLETSYPLEVPGSLALPHGTLTVQEDAAGFSYRGRLQVVFRGHEAPPPGGLRVRGHRRDLSRLLQEGGVPPWERDGYPLLMDADGLVAVPGIAVRDSQERGTAGSRRWQAKWRPLFR